MVKIRASQINGCAVCTDMHTKDAQHAGESFERIALVAAWRDATVFTDAERAALELTEQGTRLADGSGVPDEVWANAAKHYDEEQLAALVAVVALINAYSRLNAITGQPSGDYDQANGASGRSAGSVQSRRANTPGHRAGQAGQDARAVNSDSVVGAHGEQLDLLAGCGDARAADKGAVLPSGA
ncbi:MAG: carboxymuconolactone decarboxylase family protein [Actinobacteria bacterium]|nr:carboxymuconolactone decarboxylase family protein [Actinomycetota bacterium]